MMNCTWAQTLTHYDCRKVSDLHGQDALEIGTPFSLHDGSAVVLYLIPHGSHHLISDNGDTLAHLSGMGLDVWHSSRMKAIRERARLHNVTLNQAGDLRCLAVPEQTPFMFAKMVSGVLAVADWAAQELDAIPTEKDLAAEAEPYIIARNPGWQLERRKAVIGASHTKYHFAFRHGTDLIDVIAPSAQATGGVMRKAGDVLNGPFAEGMSPLIIVDDRDEPGRAHQEISIIGSMARAMPFSRLMQPQNLH